MNLHAIVGPIVSVVNPNVSASFQASSGNATGADGTVTPQYLPAVRVSAQVQDLTSADLQQAEGLNLQGHMVSIYLYGSADGVLRVKQTGGDLITVLGGANAGTYLVTKVLERWPDWVKVLATLQNGRG